MCITAKASKVGSRKEAWEDAEAALAKKIKGFYPRNHMKKWGKAFKGAHQNWFLFTFDVRPNRGEIKVKKINGEFEWLNIMREGLYEGREKIQYFYVNDEIFPEHAVRQKEVLDNPKKFVYPYHYVLDHKVSVTFTRPKKTNTTEKAECDDGDTKSLVDNTVWLDVFVREGSSILLLPENYCKRKLKIIREVDILRERYLKENVLCAIESREYERLSKLIKWTLPQDD